jgi:hypothetical protein
MVDKLTEAVGFEGNAIKMPNADKFNKKYRLYADQGVKATTCCTPSLTKLCVEEGNIVLEVNDGNLLVYWLETDIKPAELQDKLATAGEIARIFEEL